MKNKVAIYGAGGHARVIHDSISMLTNLQCIEFLSDVESEANKTLNETPIYLATEARLKQLKQNHVKIIIGIGNIATRTKIDERIKLMNFTLASVIAPSAVIGSNTQINEGVFIAPGGIVNAGSVIGRNAIVNTRVSVDHDCNIGENVHLSPGVILGGHVTIGKNSWIGLGSSIKDRINIGENSIIGAGSVVVKDVSSSCVAYGNPCKPVRNVSEI